MSRREVEFALHLTALKLPEPEREFRFDPRRRWRADFAWPDHKLLVEIDGGAWSRGRHVRGAGFERDLEKHNRATELGYMVLRFTPRMVRSGYAVRLVAKVLDSGKSSR